MQLYKSKYVVLTYVLGPSSWTFIFSASVPLFLSFWNLLVLINIHNTLNTMVLFCISVKRRVTLGKNPERTRFTAWSTFFIFIVLGFWQYYSITVGVTYSRRHFKIHSNCGLSELQVGQEAQTQVFDNTWIDDYNTLWKTQKCIHIGEIAWSQRQGAQTHLRVPVLSICGQARCPGSEHHLSQGLIPHHWWIKRTQTWFPYY